MEQLILLVKYQTKLNKRKDFVKEVISSGVLEEIRQEDSCISYDYYYDAVNPACVLLVEQWQSKGQQQQHLRSEHMHILKEIKEKYVLDTSVREISV